MATVLRRGVLRGQGDRPLVLYVAGLVLVVLGIPQVLFVGLMIREALADPDGAMFGALGVEQLTATQFLTISPVVVLAGMSPLALGYGLLAGRRWARPLGAFLWFGLALVTWGGQVLTAGGTDRLGYELLWGLILTGLAYSYLYRSSRVRAYYRRLERSRDR